MYLTKTLLAACLGWTLVTAIPSTAKAQSKQRPVSPASENLWLSSDLDRNIDAIFASFARNDSPGYVLGLIKDGKLVFAKGYGEANLDDHIPLNPQSAFHLASVSKQFTAAAIALLILDGKLSLEDSVSKYIPETKKYGDGIRIKHLIYMTSGLHEYLTVGRQSGQPWMGFYYFTRDEAVSAALKPNSLEFAPGTRWAYSNTNYMILTKIVEQVSGLIHFVAGSVPSF